MIYRAEPYTVQDMITKAPRDGGCYKVTADGRLIGFVGYEDDAAILLHERVNPLQAKQIREQLSEQLAPQVVGQIYMPKNS